MHVIVMISCVSAIKFCSNTDSYAVCVSTKFYGALHVFKKFLQVKFWREIVVFVRLSPVLPAVDICAISNMYIAA